MVVLQSLLNRRFSMALLAFLALPFLYVTLGRLSTSANSKSSVDPSKSSKPKSGKKFPSMADLTFSTGSKSFGMSAHDDPMPEEIVRAVRNETLGFGAILLISLKYRTDRQDAVTLIGSSQGISITKLIPAVQGEEINEKALPWGEAKEKLPLPYLGSWRSHMDAFKYIVDNKIETALVLEDDIDWDIHVKSQMEAFSRGLRSSPLRKPLTEVEQARAPYGLDWDVMHLGTSRNHMAPYPFDNLYSKYHDDWRTPQEMVQRDSPCGERDFFCWHDILTRTNTNATERVIFPSYSPVGLVSLAVSYSGARKLLYALSWKGLNTSMDFGVKDGCEAGTLRGWSVTPPIMSSWRTNGAGDSDLRNGGKGAPGMGFGNLRGEGIGLGWSARRHLEEEFDSTKNNFWKNNDARWYGEMPAPVPRPVQGAAQVAPPVVQPPTPALEEQKQQVQDSQQLPPAQIQPPQPGQPQVGQPQQAAPPQDQQQQPQAPPQQQPQGQQPPAANAPPPGTPETQPQQLSPQQAAPPAPAAQQPPTDINGVPIDKLVPAPVTPPLGP